MSAGLVLNPATSLAAIEEAVRFADYVLVMSVDPGFGGQSFIPGSVDKIRRVRAMLPPGVPLEVDGGISVDTIGRVAAAGASWFVAGSAVFSTGDPDQAFKRLQSLAWGSV